MHSKKEKGYLVKHTRCRSLQRSSTTSAWLHQLAIATLIIVNGSLMYAAPCQPTKAADTGTSIWTIADIAQAAVGGPTNLDLVNQPRIISQDQLPLIISESGRYILCEDLTSAQNDPYAISIEANNVTLLLNGHTISKLGQTNSNNAAIIAAEDVSNIVIKGGTLVITGDGSPTDSLNAVRLTNVINAVVKDIQVFGTSQATTFAQRGVQILGGQGITISGITASEITDGYLYTNASAIVTRDCISADAPGVGFEATIFTDDASDALLYKRCTSQASLVGGFIIFDATDALLDQCYSVGDGSNGFLLDRIDSPGILNGYTRDCIADNTSGDGFAFGSGATHVGAISCVAFNATGNGFVELNSAATASFYRCTSHNNGGDGFNASATSSVALYNCLGFANVGSDFAGAAAGTVFSASSDLGGLPGVSGNMTTVADVNDFWPNLST
jgi:hypothetical protein